MMLAPLLRFVAGTFANTPAFHAQRSMGSAAAEAFAGAIAGGCVRYDLML
jgi:hypothetical protein